MEGEQQGSARADYGKNLIPALADRLTIEFGTGYGLRNLAYCRKLYLEFSDLEILHTRVQNLSWSHIRRILSVSNPKAREWYLKTAAQDMWSAKTLDRNISTQNYERKGRTVRGYCRTGISANLIRSDGVYQESDGSGVYGIPSR